MVDVTKAELAADDGASLVGFKLESIDAAVTTAEAKLRAVAVDAKIDFGCAGDGTFNLDTQIGTDDTDAMLAFFEYCIEHEAEGYIPAGVYAVD